MKLHRIRLLLIAGVFGLLTTTASAESIKIGVSAPLSGDGAAFGTDIKNAVTLANEKFGKGRYTLVFEDERHTGAGFYYRDI
ncbi:MAG: hypothetical protein DCC75_13645 [Proteobacteria bacterium]|nr:MAG: hypothetical protein DCC75_13645 [Pseudomonadota bacterium]